MSDAKGNGRGTPRPMIDDSGIADIEEFLGGSLNEEDILDDFDSAPVDEFELRDTTEYQGKQMSLELCASCNADCDPSCTEAKETAHPYNKLIQEDQQRIRSTTGVIKIMRANGDNEAADLLEEIRETTKEAKRLLDGLSGLHKKRTGQYPDLKALKASRQHSGQ